MPPITHAGGVVVRRSADGVRYLLVSARRNPGTWIFPKGHVEAGESAVETAIREVREEAAVEAALVAPLGSVSFAERDARTVIDFYLLEHVRDVRGGEGRKTRWCSYRDARRRLASAESRALLRAAHRLVKRSRPGAAARRGPLGTVARALARVWRWLVGA